MADKPTSVDDYLARVKHADKRAALQRLREMIKAAAPKAEEGISYRIPVFRQHGMLVGFGATRNHCAFYLLSNSTIADHKEELKGYDVSTGTIRFQPEAPLPVALVRKLVKARIKENEAGG
jgi:uncharacterized protein YdhG (YjbR/CyaY superfamily)